MLQPMSTPKKPAKTTPSPPTKPRKSSPRKQAAAPTSSRKPARKPVPAQGAEQQEQQPAPATRQRSRGQQGKGAAKPRETRSTKPTPSTGVKQSDATEELGAGVIHLGVAPASARQTTTEAAPAHLYTLPDYFPPPRDQTERGKGAWKLGYLAALIESAGHVGRALAIVDISRPTLQRARETDEEFREAERQARQQAAEVLRDEVIRRAVHGVRRYKFLKNGEPIMHPVTGEYYYEHEYSDQLATVLLKGAYPEEFADRQKIQHEATVRTQIFASRQERKEALEAAKAAAKLPT